jgi:hypothetical protein
MDTDSAYIAFSAKIFEDLIKPELKGCYINNKIKWFTRDNTKENAKIDNRTPGFLLCPKLYFVQVADHEEKKYKFSPKGIQKSSNDISKERCEKVIFNPKFIDVRKSWVSCDK